MLRIITGGAGSGKSDKLITELMEIKNSPENKDKKIIFIVPEQFSYESDKKLYKKLGVEKFNQILSLSFTSLAKEIFEKHGGKSAEYAEDIHKFILMNRAIKKLSQSDSFLYYERQAKRTGFVNEALAVINEFRQCAVSSEKLYSFYENDKSNKKLHDLSMLYVAYEEALKEADLKDSLTDISEAAAMAQGFDYFKDSIIFFDEFESFTGDQYELIDVMFEGAQDIYIAIRSEQDLNSENSLFESARKTIGSFRHLASDHNMTVTETECSNLKYDNDDLKFLNKHIFRYSGESFGHAENISVVQCRDLYEEAEFAAAQIRELVMKHGYKYNDIAVISRQLDDYTYILDSVFRKYDIPFFMNVRKKAAHTSIMQFMINTVNIIAEESPSLDSVLTFLKTTPKIVSLKKINMLEEYAFEWNLKGRDFFEPFTIGIDEDKYSEIEEYRLGYMGAVTELREKCRNADCKQICRNLYDFLFETKIPMNLLILNNTLIDAGLINEAKEQKRIWNSLMKMLDVFSETCPGADITEFAGLWQSAAESITYSTPPQTLDSVHIAHAETARLASPKIVFILGVNEGIFPYNVKSSGLLNDKDRIKFYEANIRLSRSTQELISDEKLIVYKSLTHASQKLYITYPLADNMGAERFPSSIINQIYSIFDSSISAKASDKDLLFYSTTPKAAYSNFVRSFGKDKSNISEIKQVLSEDSDYNSRINYLYEVMNQKDFHVDDNELMKKLYGEKFTISPTNFEAFHKCHFNYFCKTGLHLRKPERREIKPSQTGSIVHEALETILSSCKTKSELEKLSEQEIIRITNDVVDKYMDNNLGGSKCRNRRLDATLNEIKSNIVKIALHLKKELMQSDFYPVEFEFNIVGDEQLPVLKTENGVEIFLNGKIDRVDVYENKETGKKYLRVIDYKTGSQTFSVGSLMYGINMQMILYLFSITDENGRYKDCIPSGVLYMPSKEIKNARNRNDKTDIEKYLDSNYKMFGLVLRERHVLEAMEKDIKGVYIPAQLVKADTGSGDVVLHSNSDKNCFSSNGFKKLREHTRMLLTQLANELYDGNIEANPLVIGKSSPCDYCDFSSICGNSGEKIRKPSEDADDKMLELLGEKRDKDKDKSKSKSKSKDK